MEQFERWQAWTGGVSREDQAVLWLGMGIVEARFYSRHERLWLSVESTAETLQNAALTVGTATVRVGWRPPLSGALRNHLALRVADWLRLIKSAMDEGLRRATGLHNSAPTLRLRLLGMGPPFTPYHYQNLLLAGPWKLALTRPLRRAGSPTLRWPLRLAYLSRDEPAAYANALKNHWTTEKLSQVYELDGTRTNCDLLWFDGTCQDLIHALSQRDVRYQANIVVIQNEQDEWRQQELVFAAKMLGASVVVTLHRWEDPQKQGKRLNEFMKEFSHDAVLDVALTRAFQDVAWIWASERAAEYHLTNVVEHLEYSLQRLPDTALAEFTQMRGVVVSGATNRPASPLRARDLKLDVSNLVFTQESQGATDLATIARAISAATAAPPPADAQSMKEASDRRLQLDAYLDGHQRKKAAHGFPMDTLATVAIRIGLPDERYQSAPGAPTEFSQGNQFSNLTVWLTEPDQLDEPMQEVLRLPPFGSSKFCKFSFYPKKAGLFDGGVSVVHRGRVLQTARLLAAVPSTEEKGSPEGAPRFDEVHFVRQSMADLDHRRRFNLSIVTNHTADSEPRMVALSERRAWVTNTSALKVPLKSINTLLSEVAGRAKTYVNGLDDETGRALLVQLARLGSQLHVALIGEQLARPTNNPELAGEEYIQIVSTRSDGVIPFEFIYNFPLPDLKAELCPNWRSSLASGACAPNCELHSVPKHKTHVCPLGFWGQQKVIERHLYTPEHASDGKDLFLQSEPNRATSELTLRGSVVVASSKNVEDKGRELVASALAPFAFVKPALVNNWAEWKAAVISQKPALILSMPHADVALGEVSLEIGGVPMATIDIDGDYVKPEGSETSPIVVLLGCDTAEAIEDYSRHIQWIRSLGAAVVVATISTVAGLQAPTATARLARSIFNREGATFFLGEAIREMRREALLANELIPLALVAYGDADWKIRVGD